MAKKFPTTPRERAVALDAIYQKRKEWGDAIILPLFLALFAGVFFHSARIAQGLAPTPVWLTHVDTGEPTLQAEHAWISYLVAFLSAVCCISLYVYFAVWAVRTERQRRSLGGSFLLTKELKHNAELREVLSVRQLHEAETQVRVAASHLAALKQARA